MNTLGDGNSGHTLTGLERITALEYQVRDQREDIKDLKNDVKDMKEMLQQGRGAMRAFNILLVVLGYLGVDQVGRPLVAALMKKLGS